MDSVYRNPLAEDEEVLASLTPADSAQPQQPASRQPVSVAPATTALLTSEPADGQVQYEAETAATNEQGSLRRENFLEHAMAKTSATRAAEVQLTAPEADNEEAVDEADDDDDSNSGDGDDGAYAAEYRSLLFRVAEMEAQEQQRARQGGFALRMAQRETKLMTEVAAQQQAYLASQARGASCLHASGGATASTNASADSEKQMTISSAGAWPSAEDLTADVATEARLACLAHRMEHAQLQYRRCTEAAGLLRSHARWMRAEAEHQERWTAETEELLYRLHEDAGLADAVSATAAGQRQEEPDCTRPLTASPLAASPLNDMWQRQTNGLTTLGGTLAKVHTLFRDPECCTNMSVVATALTEVGRRCQCLLQELQALTEAALQTEADLRQRRVHALEWSLFAAHAQQALELRDLYSPVTLAEMRAMGLRKILLRRRQELQTALTLAVLRNAERAVTGAGRAATASCSAPVPQPSCIFTSPPHEVTPEKMKAVADTCARHEGLRDRLLRELLYLKKCARRVLGAAWVSQTEATAIASLAATADTRGNSRTLEAVLVDNLRRASYNGLARLIAFVASTPKPPDERDDAARGDISDPHEDVDDEGKAQDEGDGLAPLPRSHSSVPAASLATRVQVLSMLEAVQTRANSLVSLLAENAKHWQRTQDVVVEAEVCAHSSEDAWCRTAELLLRRCMDADAAEPLSSDTRSDDANLHNPRTAPLLLQEQQLLDSLHASQATIVEAINAALAQVHHRCMAPLEREKRDVALLIRLLQLCDEAGESECQRGDASSADVPVTSTTPELESAMQLLTCAEDDERESDAVGKDRLLSQVRVPQLPLRVDAIQGTISALSAEWKNSLVAETAEVRAKFTETQAKLDQYAQYSMAEVPSLLEKALAKAKALQERAAECTARNSSAASLAAQIQQQRKLLTDTTTTERYALAAAMQQARLEVEALQAQVAQLQKQKDLSTTETLDRCEVRKAESVAWKSLLLDDPGQHQAVNADGAGDGAIKDEDSVDIKQEASDSPPEVTTDAKAETAERDREVGGGAAKSEVASAKRDDEAEGLENTREEEAEAGADAAEGGDEQGQQFGDEPAEEVAAESEPEERDGDALAFTAKRPNEEGADKEAHPLQVRDDAGAEGEEAVGEHDAGEEILEEKQDNAQSRKDERTTQDRVDEAPRCTTAAGTNELTEVVRQVEVKGKKKSRKRPSKNAQREVQQWPGPHAHQQQQQPSILGEYILGHVEAGQRPPVFDTAASDLFSHYPPPSVFPTEPSNRPVYDDNPFYSGFGFEEE
ncbi:conserved hypothetical protein [Leishmania infantum JPCM5]|uniref:Uncharacterized protein n=2 Tax=Leishmania infantum TaxID=5671 RepID=A4I4R5_LEIIN|nr:conserved hypothetical protein [Leishmania infantum JPCM5]CAC9509771.1 hypothetical_protein_-_conserved [Leishmania infantum]CAM69780.1 conserved hypothetical protein [Leishmania infantum JPCM5]SUZ43727.1 hypothetical_protein_-_conserved [Leishmania infantum]|eukprot:XP_001466734.1 conserved hypothetical protein [Leishmania infantum JPCM5]